MRYISSILVFMIFLAGCGSGQPLPRGGFVVTASFSSPIPHDQIALWISGDQPSLAWVGEPNVPNIRLAHRLKAPVPLALGILPRALSGHALVDGQAQLLWLDQNLAGEDELVGGTLNSAGELERGPTSISEQPTLDYVALATGDGGVLAVWTAVAPRATPFLTPLLMTFIDSAGRPYAPQQVARSGRFPAAVIGSQGRLHVAWLTTENGSIWAVNLLSLDRPDALLRAQAAPQIAPIRGIGVVALNRDEAITRVQLASSQGRLFVLWELSSTASPVYRLGGLQLEPDAPFAARSLPLAQQDARYSLFNLNVPGTDVARLVIAAVVQTRDGYEAPAWFVLTEQGISDLALLSDPIRQISRPSLLIDSAGVVHMAWAAQQRDGTSQVICVTGR